MSAADHLSQSHSSQSSSFDTSLSNQSTSQDSFLAGAEDREDPGDLPEPVIEPLEGGNDSIYQNEELSAVTSIHGEEDSLLSGTCDQASISVQNSVQMGESAKEQPGEDHPSDSTKEHPNKTDDPDYSEGSTRVKRKAKNSKRAKKGYYKRLDAMNGLSLESISGRDRRILNLNNAGEKMRIQLWKQASAARRHKTSNT